MSAHFRTFILNINKKSILNQINFRLASALLINGSGNSRRTLCSNATAEFIKFDDFINDHRDQAKRSIIVQVQSENSCTELYNYCSKIAPITNMFHYTYQKNHYVLVEFSDYVVETVLHKCSHSNSTDQNVPVRSPVLWFKASSAKSPSKMESKPMSIIFCPPENTWSCVAAWIKTAQTFSEAMRILHASTKLNEIGSRLRFLTAFQLELSLIGMFPNCAAIPFGSTVNGFGKSGCDLDLVLQHTYQQPENEQADSRLIYQTKINSGGARVHTQRQMELIADIIQVYLPGCSGVKRILQARVPIVKFTHEITGLDCDVSLASMSGVYMSELLYIFSNIQPEILPQLVFTVKRWASNVGLTNPTPGRWITNFTLTLLCIFYMQDSNLLPSLDFLRQSALKEDKRFTDDINCTFLRDLSKLSWNKTNSPDLEHLFKGFMDFYTKFDFSLLGISISSGKSFSKPDFSPMYIANPLEKSLNVSKNLSAEEVVRLKKAVRDASWAIEMDEPLLSVIGPQDLNADLIKRERRYIPNRMVTVKDLFTQR